MLAGCGKLKRVSTESMLCMVGLCSGKKHNSEIPCLLASRDQLAQLGVSLVEVNTAFSVCATCWTVWLCVAFLLFDFLHQSAGPTLLASTKAAHFVSETRTQFLCPGP